MESREMGANHTAERNRTMDCSKGEKGRAKARLLHSINDSP
jgi:hypothetical protein